MSIPRKLVEDITTSDSTTVSNDNAFVPSIMHKSGTIILANLHSNFCIPYVWKSNFDLSDINPLRFFTAKLNGTPYVDFSLGISTKYMFS